MYGMTGSPDSPPVRCQIQPAPPADPSEAWLLLTALSEKGNEQRGVPWVSFKGKGLYFCHTWFHRWNVRKTHYFLSTIYDSYCHCPPSPLAPPQTLSPFSWSSSSFYSIIFIFQWGHSSMYHIFQTLWKALPALHNILHREKPGSLILIRVWCWCSKVTKKGLSISFSKRNSKVVLTKSDNQIWGRSWRQEKPNSFRLNHLFVLCLPINSERD